MKQPKHPPITVADFISGHCVCPKCIRFRNQPDSHRRALCLLQPLREEVRDAAARMQRLERELRWLAQTVHQSYAEAHGPGSVDTCPRSTCMSATRALNGVSA